MKVNDNPINNALFQLLSKALFGTETEFSLNGEQLEQLFCESKSQTVISLVFDVLPKEYKKINPVICEKWENLSLSLFATAINIGMANSSLIELLEKAGIKACIIKGLASAVYYPKPYLRQMGDVDFLVAEEDVEKALDTLNSNGYITEDREHMFHIGLKKNKTEYELHTKIGFIPENEEYINSLTHAVIPNSCEKKYENYTFRSPDTLRHGLIILLHMQRHMMKNEGMGLRHLCDWAVFVNSMSDTEFKTVFEKEFKSIGIWKFAQIMSQICHIYLKMPYKQWFGEIDITLCEEIMQDIINGGNFGKKDLTRKQSTVFVSNGNEERPYIFALCKSLGNIVCGWKPFFKTHRLLIPAGFVGYAFHILFQLITGKKKVNYLKASKTGVQRNNTYKKLDIFKNQDD